MEAKMLFYILFGCFLPLTIAQVTSPVSAQMPTGQQTETSAHMSTFEVVTGPSTNPGKDASEILTSAATANVETSADYATNSVQQRLTESNGPSTLAVPKSKDLEATTNMDATITYQTISAQSTVVPSRDTPTSVVQSGESSDLTTKSVQSTISSEIASTTSSFLSSQTSQTKEETTILGVGSEKPPTHVYPTAKLSATTQNTATVEKTTTRLFKTSKASTIKPFVPIEVTNVDEKKPDNREKALGNGKIVAGIIGGALTVMVIGFLVILYKKHKLKKHQIETSAWAGPTPFLETGSGNGQVSMRSSNRISLTSFLPQRLSKRLSLLPEIGEEMQELTPGTFAGKQEKEEVKNGNKPTPDTSDDSENSTRTEDDILVHETSQTKEGEKPENGQIQKEADNVQAKTNEEESENTPTAEDSPKNDDKTGDVESYGPDLV